MCKALQTALFFIELAIENFQATGRQAMKASCETLREEILKNHKSVLLTYQCGLLHSKFSQKIHLAGAPLMKIDTAS